MRPHDDDPRLGASTVERTLLVSIGLVILVCSSSCAIRGRR